MKTKKKTKITGSTKNPTSAAEANDKEPEYPVYQRDKEKVVSINTIREELVRARDLTCLVKQYALEAVLYAKEALDLDPSDFTAADEGEYDDEDDAKMKLVTKLNAMLEWSTEVNGDLDRAVSNLYQHDTEAQAEAKANTAEWNAKHAEYMAKKAAYDAKRNGGAS
jgi:hypothetical protein